MNCHMWYMLPGKGKWQVAEMSLTKISQIKDCFRCEKCEYSLTVRAVPLFTPCKNKELTDKIGGTSETFSLSDLVKSVGVVIDLVGASFPSVCKKCDLKISLQIANQCNCTEETNEGGKKRLHGNSPIPPKWQGQKSKKTLFEISSAWSEKERVKVEIANLMCLPVTKNIPSSFVVKVFIFSLSYICIFVWPNYSHADLFAIQRS